MTADPLPPTIHDALEELAPLIQQQLRRRLGVTMRASDFRAKNLDAQDLLVMVQIKLLEKAGKGPDGNSDIRNLRAYTRLVTDSVINDYIRHLHPEWTRLKNRLRRFLEGSRCCSVWEDGPHGLVVGLKDWMNRPTEAVDADKGRDLLENSTPFAATIRSKPPDEFTRKDWETIVDTVVRHIGAPAPLDNLVSIVARILNLEDPVEISEKDEAEILPQLPASPNREPYPMMLEREWRRALWIEVKELVPWHRAAFLLNLPTDFGEIQELPEYGIASMAEIGRCLDLADGELSRLMAALDLDDRDKAMLQSQGVSYDVQFAMVWNRLPLQDNVISALLNKDRASVIGYRNKAKEKIQRRLQKSGYA
jgi:hypothetical protein